MNLTTVIRELNSHEMHRHRSQWTATGDRFIEKRDPDHGWVFLCWADQRDVRGLLEVMGVEYEPLIKRLDREGLAS